MLLAMQAVWFFTWLHGIEQGIITGLAIALTAGRASRHEPVPRLAGSPR